MEDEPTNKALDLSAIPVIKQGVKDAVATETTARENAINTVAEKVEANATAISNEAKARADADTELEGKISTNATAITSETTNREEATNRLQSQIDALENASDVVDVVSTYAELESYDTASLGDKDIIKVMQDSTHGDAVSYYRWDKTNSKWVYVGSEGPYYTKSEANSEFVPQSRTVNGQALSNDVRIDIPTKVSQLQNDQNYATESYVDNQIGDINAALTKIDTGEGV